MKVGIICFWDREATPYLAKYEKAVELAGLDYEILFWNRSGKKHNTDNKELEITLPLRRGIIGKLVGFYRWRKEVRKKLKERRYEYLIVLTTYPAVLLFRELLGEYSGRYIFDIRDYSMERNFVFKSIVSRIIDSSGLTAFSSKGFRRWLPSSSKLVLNHNITGDCLNKRNQAPCFCKEQIKFSFVGNIRLDKQTKSLLITLSKSSRFVMEFVGRILPECDILEICSVNNIKNVIFKGAFKSSDKPAIYSSIDLINAVYANDADKVRYADSTPLPNRVYDAAIFKRPIVASKGTYLAELIEQFSLGFSLNGFDENAASYFEDYIVNFDRERFVAGCNRFLDEVLREETAFRDKLTTELLRWKE